LNSSCRGMCQRHIDTRLYCGAILYRPEEHELKLAIYQHPVGNSIFNAVSSYPSIV
jgi:hypothetical protein